ncbi:sigma 54-interacting transcriptional regulator [Peptoniphilus equinus]|uniref:Sigma 54-interacting transcriptional regulator n=1 Tax=Peptoniphilus equinus TaxID=3016343 RepID=A0ABY7QUW0_9FIRM|nr:sigma 54-interacting transcriptional regulator [Peptoniphilus equinus]WBW50572.1 sigma 54-interacting transcriptional regulator [Peptoniphilus equinus]
MQDLNLIKHEADKYVKMLADIGGGDVELIDRSIRRICGQGAFQDDIGKTFELIPLSYQKAMETKKQIVVYDARHDPLVTRCPVFQHSNFTALIASPIIIAGKVEGILGSTIQDELAPLLSADLDLFATIVKQTADFIAAEYTTILDYQDKSSMLNMFEVLVRSMEEGAIVIDDKSEIQIINQSAKQQLGIKKIIDKDKITINKTGDSLSGADEFIIKIGERVSTVIGKIITFDDQMQYFKIILFRDMGKLKSSIYSITNQVTSANMDSILGSSEAIQNLKRDILKVSKSTSAVLVTGESGTGKELVASAIWQSSNRKDERFVAVNCASVPENILEYDLFGYVKGASEGSDSEGRVGKFELANKGVLFLDEIGNMPLYLQSKLLRVIEEHQIQRIGSNQIIPLDVRLITATNQDLKELIKQNKFRDDLYYRISVIPLEIKPLRERPQDIDDLVAFYIGKYTELFGKVFRRMDKEVQIIIRGYRWPGNIRELENVVEYMVNMMEDGIIHKRDLPENMQHLNVFHEQQDAIQTIEALETLEIKKALDFYGHTTAGKAKAAEALGIGIATLYRKLKAYNLTE